MSFFQKLNEVLENKKSKKVSLLDNALNRRKIYFHL